MAPTVTIVVATRNRAHLLPSCLEALLAQEPPNVAEVVVVDDASQDGTPGFLESLSCDGRLTALRGTGAGPAAARNAGIRAARGDVVAFTDDDCVVPRDWAARLASRLRDRAVGVGGRVVAAPDASRPARLSQAITNGFVTALNQDPADAVFLTSNNAAYRAEALREAGLFDEAFRRAGGEERELNARLRARGGRLAYAPDVVVAHAPPLDWLAFLRQQSSYGRGARLLYRRGRTLGPAGPRPLGPRACLRAFRAAFREVGASERVALAAALVASQAAVAWGFVGFGTGGR